MAIWDSLVKTRTFTKGKSLNILKGIVIKTKD